MSKYAFLGVAVFVLFATSCKEMQIKKSDFAPFKKPVTLSTTTEEVEKKTLGIRNFT